MPGNGPPPKPDGRRQRRNTRTSTDRAGAGLVAFPGGKLEAPAPPAGVLEVTKRSWSAFWGSQLAGLLVPETDGPVVARLWSLYDERERAYRGYRKHRLVDGSQGQPVLNPLFSAMAKLDAEIRALEDRLGLSPMARLRLGVQLGEAARSLEDLNRGLDDDDDLDAPDTDPRVGAVVAAARPAPADAGAEGLPVDRAAPRSR